MEALGQWKFSANAEAFRHMGLSAIEEVQENIDQMNPDNRANSLAFNNDGSLLFAAYNDEVVRVFDGATCGKKNEFQVKKRGCRLITATHSPAAVLHSSSSASTHAAEISYHDLETNQIIRIFRGHSQMVCSLAMNPHCDAFLSTSLDGTYRIWDIRAPVPICMGTIPTATHFYSRTTPINKWHAPCGAFDSTGRVFAVATQQRGLALFSSTALFDTKSGWATAPFTSLKSPMGQFLCHPIELPGVTKADIEKFPKVPELVSTTGLAFSPVEDKHGAMIAINTRDRGVIVVHGYFPWKEYTILRDHPLVHPDTSPPGSNGSLAWSPNGKLLLVAGADGHIWGYDMSNPPELPGSDDDPYVWRPGGWSPPSFLLGEVFKTPAARNAAFSKAKEYNSLSKDNSQVSGGAISEASDPTSARKESSLLFAANPDEQVSRLESEVQSIAINPRTAVVASASRCTALWSMSSHSPSVLRNSATFSV